MDPKLLKILENSKKVMTRSEELKPLKSPNEEVGNLNLNYNIPQNNLLDYSNTQPNNIYENYQTKGVGGKNLPKEIYDMMVGQNQNMISENNFQDNRSDYVLISKKELKDVVNESLKSFLKQYSHKLEEAVIKKTIKTLLNENKRGK